ncbi:MAG: hypothetical protein WCI02_14085 [Planctomycetota bacterium]
MAKKPFQGPLGIKSMSDGFDQKATSKSDRPQVDRGQIGVLSWLPRFDYEHEHEHRRDVWGLSTSTAIASDTASERQNEAFPPQG